MAFFDFMRDKPVPPPAQIRFSAVGSDFETWNTLVGMYAGSTVSRKEAMSVPAIKKARDKYCNLANILPLQVFNNNGERLDSKLLNQPEKFNGLTANVTLSRTFDDLFFYGASLWKVAAREYTTFPGVVDRIPWGRWSIDEATGKVMVDGVKMNPLDCIIFPSPNDGLLGVGGGPIKALLALEATAAMRINQPQAMEYFRTNDRSTPDQTAVDDFLVDIAAARKNNASGWLPWNIDRIPVEAITPEQLQLQSARDFSILEVSRMTGLSPYDLGVPVHTNTYQNLQDERRDFIENKAPFLLATVESRLSLNDVTPNGQKVRFNYDAFLRPNTTERYQSYQIALSSPTPWLTLDEIRDLENRPPMEEQ